MLRLAVLSMLVALAAADQNNDMNAHCGNCACAKDVCAEGDLGGNTLNSTVGNTCTTKASVTQMGYNGSAHNERLDNCPNLKHFVGHDNLILMDRQSINNCPNLESIIYGEGLVKVNGVDQSCNKLTSVTLGSNTVTIGGFENCPKLTSIVLPDSLTTIEENAFSQCSKLTNVTLGDASKIEFVASEAFSSTPLLTSIAVPASFDVAAALAASTFGTRLVQKTSSSAASGSGSSSSPGGGAASSGFNATQMAAILKQLDDQTKKLDDLQAFVDGQGGNTVSAAPASLSASMFLAFAALAVSVDLV